MSVQHPCSTRCPAVAGRKTSPPAATILPARWRPWLLGLGIALGLAGMTGAGRAATEVRLRSQTRCASAVVRLGDLAEIFSDDLHLADILADIPLRPAPARDVVQTLSRQEVQQLLVLSGVAPAGLFLTGSEQVRIEYAPAAGPTRSSRRGLVAEGVRQAVLEAESAPAGQDPKVRRAAGARPAGATVPRPLPAADPDATGSPERPLVERGAQVKVLARTAGIRITTAGKALESGRAGERIQVELDDHKQRVLARVVGWQAVEVTVGEPPTPFAPAGSGGGSAPSAAR